MSAVDEAMTAAEEEARRRETALETGETDQGGTVTPLPDDESARQREASRLFAEASRLHRQGRLLQAVAAYDKSIGLWPRFPDAYNNLGVALRGLGRLEAAVACYRRSLSIRPNDAGIHSNLGNALRELGRYNHAAAAHQQAVTLSPQSPVAIFNLALVLRDLGHLDEAIGCFERALAIRPDYIDCRWERALTLLQNGDFRRGFEEYAWRGALRSKMRRPFEQPVWEGEDLEGRRILVHFDQRPSDMVQFARYIALVADGAGDGAVHLECPIGLIRLCEGMPGVDSVIASGEPLPDFDVQIPLSSLPALFGTSLDTVPRKVPYLHVPAQEAYRIAPADRAALKVGIAWAGNPEHHDDPQGDCPLRHIIDLADLAGVSIYSLQSGRAARDRDTMACDVLIRDTGVGEGDMVRMAAVIAEMDLVVTVDSVVAHLAGALGRPVWLLLPFVSDWRWMVEREDSPWYPTMALFRQERHGDWAGTVARVRQALIEAGRAAAARREAG